MRVIDLNADMGEYADDQQRDIEAALMPFISSCSIACGGHAGDQETMHHTSQLARQHGVSIGAHPAYPDTEGFGRSSIEITPQDLLVSLKAQVDALRGILKENNITLRHVKAHGALYNDAAKNSDLARIVVEAAGDVVIVGPPGSELERATLSAGKTFAAEGFVDRRYVSTGALTPRTQPNAIIENTADRAKQALSIAAGASFDAEGGALTLTVKTLCIHSDSPGAVDTARQIRQALEDGGFTVRAF